MSKRIVTKLNRNQVENKTESQFLITINSNQDSRKSNIDMKSILFDDLFINERALDKIIGPEFIVPISDKPESEPNPDFTSFSEESGKKFHRLHWHITLSIKSFVPTYNGGLFGKRLKKWLNRNHPLPRGSWMVFVTNHNATANANNYVNKEARRPKLIETFRNYPNDVLKYTVVENKKTPFDPIINNLNKKWKNADRIKEELKKAGMTETEIMDLIISNT